MKLRLVVTTLLLCLTLPGQSFAHSGLTATSPGDGETVEGGVSNIALSFADSVRVTLVKLVRSDENETVEPVSDLPPAFVQTLEAEVPPLQPGTYEAHWTAVSKDGHVMTGAFSFTVVE